MPQGLDNVLQFFNPANIPYALFVGAFAFVLVRVLDRAFDRLAEAFSARRMLFHRLDTIVRFTVYTVAVILAVSSVLHVTKEGLWALSGTFALVLGFALKDVGASALAGITVLIDKSFQVGDRISFAGWYGDVVDIGLRSVRVRTLDDNMVTIPSNKFLTEAVASANAGALDAMVVMPFHIHPDADHRLAMDTVRDAVTASKYINMHRSVNIQVASKVHDGFMSIQVTAKAYVYDVRHERAFASDVTDMVLRAFRKRGIRPPAEGGPSAPRSPHSARALTSA